MKSVLYFCLFLVLTFSLSSPAFSAKEKWPGVDETVVENTQKNTAERHESLLSIPTRGTCSSLSFSLQGQSEDLQQGITGEY